MAGEWGSSEAGSKCTVIVPAAVTWGGLEFLCRCVVVLGGCVRDRRRGISPFLIGALILVATCSIAGAEHVSMPFQCKIERGRVILVPAAERTYEILGQHRQQPHLFCAARDERRCRPRTVHRFDVMCGGARTSWVSVAAAATRLLGHEAWIDGGRLNVVVGVGTAQVRSECGDASWPRSLTQAFSGSPSFDRPCNPRVVERGAPRVVVLPAGFAPLAELGARVVESPVRPPASSQAGSSVHSAAAMTGTASATAAQSSAVPLAPQVPAGLPPPQAAPYAAVPAHPMPPPAATGLAALSGGLAISPAPPAPSAEPPRMGPVSPLLLHPDVADFTRQTPSSASIVEEISVPAAIVARVAEAEAPHPAPVSQWKVAPGTEEGPAAAALVRLRAELGGDQWLFLLGLLSATIAVGGLTIRSVARVTTGALNRRGSASSVEHLVRRANLVGVDDPDERVLADLRSTAEQLRQNAEALLDELRPAPPLRGVLRQEVDLIVQRLSEVPRAQGVIGPRRIRQRYQGGIRELHRVIKIAEGAAASFSAVGFKSKMPASREEAFALLGVNDSISEGTLKKLVDALRLSWHPDHARDEADRERREERIKQINVAWDLITGKRIAV